MKFSVIFTDDSIQELSELVLFELNKNEGTPVDSATLIFMYPYTDKEMKLISIKDEQNETIFDGIVDEQHSIVSNSGIFLKIYARSRAAYLLDNQALPKVYTLPSLSIIFDEHIRPYGFENIIYDSDVCLSSFNVLKGMSEWDVINLFCRLSLGYSPKITKDGTLVLGNIKSDEKIIFSNSKSGVAFTDFKYSIKRYREWSEIYARLEKDGTYSERIADDDAIARGIMCKKYINPANDKKESVENAISSMKASKKSSKEYRIKCLTDRIPEIGTPATIDDSQYGFKEGLYISDVKYHFSASKNICEITLREGTI